MLVWALCLIAITLGSLLPNIYVPEEYHLDKLIHGSSYAGLAFLSYFFTKNRRLFVSILIMLVLIGSAIEILQIFMPPRDGTIGDFAADSVGVICGAFLAVRLKPFIMRLLRKNP